MSQFDRNDILTEKFVNDRMVGIAKTVLESHDQSEADFLGAQAVMLLNGLL